MTSLNSIKLYNASLSGEIKSRADFWWRFCDIESIKGLEAYEDMIREQLARQNIELVSWFDDDFPCLKENMKRKEKTFLFAYRGDINLLKNAADNIAVVGSLTPDDRIIARENLVVEALVKAGFNIVSGLARGCDTAAHKACIEAKGKTIAFLPTSFDKIYPPENVKLIDEIVDSGGLVMTEYLVEAKSYYEMITHFIERDRLQPMFSAAVVLIASHAKGEGDSGSRHALQKAIEYNVSRYVMYDDDSDKQDPLFGLNRQELERGAHILPSEFVR